MTRDEILNMPAGREMDALVAEKVMIVEFTKHNYKAHDVLSNTIEERTYYSTSFAPLPHYSTDIAAAWQVVEKLMEMGDVFIENWQDGEWFVACDPLMNKPRRNAASCDGKKTGKESAPLAICRAALLAVMEDKDDDPR
jgi:hypothetical protein